MQKSWLERLAPLSGLISVVLMLAGALFTGLFVYLPSAARAAQHFNANASRIYLGSYPGVLSSFFLIWFAGSLWQELRGHEGGSGRLSALAFAGGVAAAVGLGLGYTIINVAGNRAGAPGGLEPIAAVTLYDLATNLLGGLYGFLMAVTVAATAVITLRHRAFPSWFGWLSVLLAILLVSPLSYVGLYFAILWVVGLSLSVFARGRSA